MASLSITKYLKKCRLCQWKIYRFQIICSLDVRLDHSFAILLQRQDVDYMLCRSGESFLGGPPDLCIKRNPALPLRSRGCSGDDSRNW